MEICVVCGDASQQRNPYWKILHQCKQCAHVMANLAESALDFKSIYSEDYFAGAEYANYAEDEAVFKKQFQRNLKLIRRYVDSGTLVELGCAYGFFLKQAQQYFQVCGYDISQEPVKYAREKMGVDARCEDFLTSNFNPSSADVAVMWDVIEHLPRPDLVAQKIFKTLKPNGYFFLTTGDIGSALAKFQKEKWRLIHPPTHLHYFNKETIKRLLTNSGFRVVDIRYIGVERSFKQIAFGLFMMGKKKRSKIYDWVCASSFRSWSVNLNTLDIMLVTAQK